MKTWAAMMMMLAGLAASQSSQPLQDAQSAIQRKDYPAALRIVRPLAQGGDPNAQTILGSMYAFGFGVARSYAEAVNWFRKAAEQGQPAAQGNLGLAYLNGQGVKQNYTEAAGWLRKAADQNDPQSRIDVRARRGRQERSGAGGGAVSQSGRSGYRRSAIQFRNRLCQRRGRSEE
jgi:TPR repeat protein